jgi:hypothetical protein
MEITMEIILEQVKVAQANCDLNLKIIFSGMMDSDSHGHHDELGLGNHGQFRILAFPGPGLGDQVSERRRNASGTGLTQAVKSESR